MAKTLIEVALAVPLIAWVLYPCAMYVIARTRCRTDTADTGDLTASVVIATRDDVSIVSKRVADIESHREEIRLVEIIVAVDPSGPTDAKRYRAALSGRALVVDGDAPGGKASTLNAGVRAVTADIVIFADSAQEYLPGALRGLVETVRRPTIGATTGHLRLESNRRHVSLRLFWTYESWLRRMESKAYSLVGVTGAIYALRTALWEPLPAGLINDDVYVAFRVVQKGFRVVNCETATAVDARLFTPREEFRRKVRTLTGILQLCRICPAILHPLRNRVWTQFVCHKLLRIVSPHAILLAMLGMALSAPLRVVSFTILISTTATAVAWGLSPRDSVLARVLRQTGWALLIISAPIVATTKALKGNWNVWGSPGSTTK